LGVHNTHFYFSSENPLFTVNYLADIFENIEISKSKFEQEVVEVVCILRIKGPRLHNNGFVRCGGNDHTYILVSN